MTSRRTFLAGVTSFAALAAAGCARRESGTAAATPSPPATTGTTTATTATTTAMQAPAAYVPPATGEWELADPAATGWSPAGLQAASALVEQSNSRTFMMLSGGRILVEQYWAGATASTPQDIASAQKSVTSTLYGIAIAKGLVRLDDPVSQYLPAGWSAAAPADEAKITIEHLLTMTSGLDPRTLKKKAEPGEVWDYNTDAYQKLRPVLEKAANADINQISATWMFDAIGITTTDPWKPRPSPTERDATGAQHWGLEITARDMARFGLLAMRTGAWADQQLVRADWFRRAWTPVPQKRDYGYLWWLLGQAQGGGKRSAPDDWVAALGAQDQKIYVIPSLDLVVTRQGLAADKATENTSDFDTRLIKVILAARA